MQEKGPNTCTRVLSSLFFHYTCQSEILDGLPAYCKAGKDIWRTMSPLVCGHLIEWHVPNPVLRQFGMEQDIPGPFDTETRVHDVDLRGKSNTDWTIEWDDYIQKWNKWAETVVTHPLLQ